MAKFQSIFYGALFLALLFIPPIVHAQEETMRGAVYAYTDPAWPNNIFYWVCSNGSPIEAISIGTEQSYISGDWIYASAGWNKGAAYKEIIWLADDTYEITDGQCININVWAPTQNLVWVDYVLTAANGDVGFNQTLGHASE